MENVNKYNDAQLEIKQEIQQIIGGNANEIENFKNFIEYYEKSIKETLFKNLDDVKYTNRYSEKNVSEYKDIIIIILNNIKEKCINSLKKADVIKIKNSLMKIKEEKILKIEENITKYKDRYFFNYEKTDQYIIDSMRELCEEFESVIDYYENPIKFQEEERKAIEEYEKKLSEKNKGKEPLNIITNSVEEEKPKKEELEEGLEIETTNGFMLRPKYLKEGLQEADLCKKYLEGIKNKGGIVNKISSNLAGFLFTFKDKFYAEREKRGKNIDATYLKNNFITKLEELKESIRVKFEELKNLLKRCKIKINEPHVYVSEYYIFGKTSFKRTDRIILSDVIKRIKKVKIEYFTRNKIFIDSEISSLFSINNVYDYALIKKQYEEILHNLFMEEYYLKGINKYLEDFENKECYKYPGCGFYGQYDYDGYKDKTNCYKYLENKFKQIANIYSSKILDMLKYPDDKDDIEDYYFYDHVDYYYDTDCDHDYEYYLYGDE